MAAALARFSLARLARGAMAHPAKTVVRSWFGFGMKHEKVYYDTNPSYMYNQPTEWLDNNTVPISAEEARERNAFRQEELNMVNGTPAQKPGKDFFQRYMAMLMKYDDRGALLGAVTLAEEYKIAFDPEFKATLDAWIKDSDVRSCFTPGL